MSASFLKFATTLGFKPQASAPGATPTLDVLSVCRSLGFSLSPTISLASVMRQIGSPLTPTQLHGGGNQFGWSDPNANLDSPTPTELIRFATSFVFELWPPGGAGVTETFKAVAPAPFTGQSFFADGKGTWLYNYPSAINPNAGAYSWRVTSVNDYGSAESPMQQIGTSGPRIWFTVNSNQTLVKVFGAGFPSNICTVTATCSMFPTSTETGDITKGVTVAIECQNKGQYWNLSVTGGGGYPTVTGKVNCSGGQFP